MINKNLYKTPPMVSGEISPDTLQIWEAHKESKVSDMPLLYTLTYITPKGHVLPILKPYRYIDRVQFVKDEILGYFHNPLEHHTEDEIRQARIIIQRSLVREEAFKPLMNHLDITRKKARALLAKILNPEEYNPFIYSVDSAYRGFNFYNHNIWETGRLPELRRPKYIFTPIKNPKTT